MLEAVKQNGHSLDYAAPELYALKHASLELKADREFILEAVKQNGYSLD